jgi:hypothetical protein
MDTGPGYRHRNSHSCLDDKIQNTYRHLARKKINQLIKNKPSRKNLHKRQLYVLKQLRNKLHTPNAIFTTAENERVIIVIDNDKYQQKINKLLTLTQFHILIRTPPTNKPDTQTKLYPNRKTQIIYLTEINTSPPKRKEQLKILKDDIPITK